MTNLHDISDRMKKVAEEYEKDCDEYWDNLEYKDQLKAFYSVVKRITKGELKDNGSYRYILYDIFGFGPEAYAIGMECGFFDLHNAIPPTNLKTETSPSTSEETIWVVRSEKKIVEKDD